MQCVTVPRFFSGTGTGTFFRDQFFPVPRPVLFPGPTFSSKKEKNSRDTSFLVEKIKKTRIRKLRCWFLCTDRAHWPLENNYESQASLIAHREGGTFWSMEHWGAGQGCSGPRFTIQRCERYAFNGSTFAH